MQFDVLMKEQCQRRKNKSQFKRARAAESVAINMHQKKCPDFGKDCRNCGGKTNFAKCCKKKVQLLEKRSDSEDEEAPIFVDSIEDGQTASADEWIAHMDVNGNDVSLKLGTGAQVNILPMKDFQKLRKKTKISHRNVNLKTYDNKTILTKGVCRASLSCNGKKEDVFLCLLKEINKLYLD